MIYGVTLSTGQEVQISSTWQFLIPGRDHYTPVIHGDTVIWKEGEEGNICGYNLSTSERLRIAAAQMGECDSSHRLAERSRRPAIYEDIVAWVDCRNGNEDIYGFNLATGEEFQIAASEERQLAPAIYEDFVVWQDFRVRCCRIYKTPYVRRSDGRTCTRHYHPYRGRQWETYGMGGFRLFGNSRGSSRDC